MLKYSYLSTGIKKIFRHAILIIHIDIMYIWVKLQQIGNKNKKKSSCLELPCLKNFVAGLVKLRANKGIRFLLNTKPPPGPARGPAH